MRSNFRQITAMIGIGLGSLPRRVWISLSMILSITLVVAVLIGFLSMAKGFEQAMTGAGSPSVAVILGGGTNQESSSTIPAEALRALQATSADLGIRRDAEGRLLVSRELVTPVDLARASDGGTEMLALRGMSAAGPGLRDGVWLVAGRLFQPGARELVVGARLAQDFRGLGVGETVRLGAADWTVVGQFSAGGTAFESEIWADLEAVQAAFGSQGKVQSLRVGLVSPQAIETLRAALPQFSTTPLVASSEADLFATQSERTSGLIRMFGWPLAVLMACGAIAGALNTMMTSVSDRTKEIATVRTLGFSRLAAFVGTCGEALVLTLIGAGLGILLSWLVFNGYQASTMGAENTRMAFQLQVTFGVMLTGGLLGLAVGVVGGVLAAFSAARIPLVHALRA